MGRPSKYGDLSDMGRPSKYGDLSDQELEKLLAEIQDEDAELNEDEAYIGRDLEVKELLAASDEEFDQYTWYEAGPYNKQVLVSPEAKEKRSNALRRSKAEASEVRAKQRIAIQREALNQNIISLQDLVPRENIQFIIATLTEEHDKMMKKYAAYINRRLGSLLAPLIPRVLREAFKQFPQSVKAAPGFNYRALSQAGQELIFWATPTLPFYFLQNTEQQAIKRARPQYLYSIDRAVEQWHKHSNALLSKQVQYAQGLASKRVRTYFDLLRAYPFWFEIIYNDLKNMR